MLWERILLRHDSSILKRSKRGKRCSAIYLRVGLRDHGLKESKTLFEGFVEVGEVEEGLALLDCGHSLTLEVEEEHIVQHLLARGDLESAKLLGQRPLHEILI